MVTQQDIGCVCLAQQPFLLPDQVSAVCPTVTTGGVKEKNLDCLFPSGEALLVAHVDTPYCICPSLHHFDR